MSPWLLLVVLVAGANWAAFLLIRGRWGRISILLALASLAGTIVGDAIGGRTGLELLQLGDLHLISACVAAQLAMLLVLLLRSLLPGRGDRVDASG